MHVSVLLQSVIDGLDLRPGLTVVDGTINGGGHSAAIRPLIPNGHLIGLDRDASAIERARQRLSEIDSLGGIEQCRVSLLAGDFRSIDHLVRSIGVTSIDRLFLDLGLSSNQLAESGRGFSFQTDEPLLMTYESSPSPEQLTAAEVINRWDEDQLTTVFRDYGDELNAKRFARAMVTARRLKPIRTTTDLVEIIRHAAPRWYLKQRRHHATKVFLALRLVVNDELGSLAQGLAAGFNLLRPGGRIAIITFHSGEARVVKNFFREQVSQGTALIINKKAIKPSREEVINNPRARSATLRIIQKNEH
ncbi:MAG: 16S rRNA (cytosine(1402)-N(4))-methyltransferase RsmH [Patescibacteria group bacterium]